MHLPEYVDLPYNRQVQVPSTGTGSLEDDDYDAGVCLTQRTAASSIPNTVSAQKSSAANQVILGTLAGNKDKPIGQMRGILIFQLAATFTNSMKGQTIITTTTAGKVAAHATNGVGRILWGGNDSVIGNYVAVLF